MTPNPIFPWIPLGFPLGFPMKIMKFWASDGPNIHSLLLYWDLVRCPGVFGAAEHRPRLFFWNSRHRKTMGNGDLTSKHEDLIGFICWFMIAKLVQITPTGLWYL
jgi:hypothetical protein